MTPPNNFDDKAKSWDDDQEHARRAQAIAQAIGGKIPHDPSLTAMDYGCGTGQLSFPLRQRFAKIVLVDNSAGMLEVLRRKIEQSRAANMEALNIDLLRSWGSITSHFSVIYSAMALHHIPDINGIFAVWHSLLSTPGYLFVADLDREDGAFHGPEFTGHKGFDRAELRTIAEAAGFTMVSYETVFEITRETPEGIARTFPVFLMSCRKM